MVFQLANRFACGGSEVTGQISQATTGHQKQQTQTKHGASSDFQRLFHRGVPFRTENFHRESLQRIFTENTTSEQRHRCVGCGRFTIGRLNSGEEFRKILKIMQKPRDCPRISLMPCFRVFRVFRGSLLFGDKIKEVIAAPRASCLLLRLGDLGALAVSLGDLNA
jgi:hypothetical protein